jgi:hypothetical protein
MRKDDPANPDPENPPDERQVQTAYLTFRSRWRGY